MTEPGTAAERPESAGGGPAAEAHGDAGDRRWRLIGDVAVFQGKLLIDGLRDLVLSPVSIGAALLGIATSRDEPGRYFYRLMRCGRWSDQAINLFNAKGEPSDDSPAAASPSDGPSIDQLTDELERALVERYARSALAKAAKESIDKSIDRVNDAPALDREKLRAAARRIVRGLERARPGRGPDNETSGGVARKSAGTRSQ